VLANILGPDTIIIGVVVVVVLLFGGKKLPSLARGIGSSASEFKKAVAEGEHALKDVHVAIVSPPRSDATVLESRPETVVIVRDEETRR
jgi:sec-independent protein translocase protein TatA